jgi:hypothetical protein
MLVITCQLAWGALLQLRSGTVSRILFVLFPRRLTMNHASFKRLPDALLAGPALATVAVIARGFWLYRASLTWPTADGVITRVDIERKRGAGGYYIRATFAYDFHDPNGLRLSGTWCKNFSSEPEACDFAAR